MTHLEIILLDELLKAHAQLAILRRYTYRLSADEQARLNRELETRNLALADNSRAEALRIARLARDTYWNAETANKNAPKGRNR